jgi:hypothetical protein
VLTSQGYENAGREQEAKGIKKAKGTKMALEKGDILRIDATCDNRSSNLSDLY